MDDLKRRRTIQLGCKGLDLASTMYAVYRLPPEPASATISHAVTLTCNIIACCHGHLQHQCMLRDRFQGGFGVVTTSHATSCCCDGIFAWMHDDLLMRVKADHVQGTLENLSFLYSLFLQVPSEGAGVEVLHD